MGAASSTDQAAPSARNQESGIVTVSRAAPSPAAAAQEDPLLRHLAALRARVPALHASIDANDPDNVWKDLEAAKARGCDTQQLYGAAANMLEAYQAWHNENAEAIIANQAYVHRSIDQAEIKARKAVQHVQQQTLRLKALQAQLDSVKGLPAMLSALCAQTADVQAALQDLEARAAAASEQGNAAQPPGGGQGSSGS